MGEVLSYGFGWVSYDFAFLSYVFRVLSYGFRFSSHEHISPPPLTRRKVHSYGKQSACGLPSGRQVPPDPFLKWVNSYRWSSILWLWPAILWFRISILRFSSSILRFSISISRTHLSSGSHPREKCIHMESSPPADCPVGGNRRPIQSWSGFTLIGEVLSYDFERLSYDFAFLSYVFKVLSYGLRFLSYELLYVRLSFKRKVHSNGKQSARGLPSGRHSPPDPF